MLKVILLCALGTLALASEESLELRYNKPWLDLLFRGDQSRHNHVMFHYTINDQSFDVEGELTTNGWEFHTADIDESNVGHLVAYATYYDKEEHEWLETETTTIEKDMARRAVGVYPGKTIRGVIFKDTFDSLNTKVWLRENSLFGKWFDNFGMTTESPLNVRVENGHLILQPRPTTDDKRYDDNWIKHGTIDININYPIRKCTAGFQKGPHNGCYHKATDSNYNPPVTQGRVKSSVTMKYGQLKVKARIPRGDWLWPAIWMMPQTSTYGGWPRSGEVDLMESRGNAGSWGVGRVGSNFHWGTSRNDQAKKEFGKFAKNKNWALGFQTWQFDWSDSELKISLNGETMSHIVPKTNMYDYGKLKAPKPSGWKSKIAPFDIPFYIILSNGAGSQHNYFTDFGQPWKNTGSFAQAVKDFWDSKDKWIGTWKGTDTALMVDEITITR